MRTLRFSPAWPLAWALAAAAGLAQAQPQPAPPVQAAPTAPAAPAATAPAAPAGLPALAALPPAPPLPAEPGRVYAPGPFDRLELGGAARVTLYQGEHDRAFIAGDEDVQKSVEVELSNRQLVIRQVGGWKFWHSTRINVQVEMRQLRQITLSGASDLHAPAPLRVDQLRLNISGAGMARLDQVQAQHLVFDVSGAGEGQLGGRADELLVRISGKGKVMADQLKAQHARVSVSGIGNVTLWVVEDLAANISGVGSIDYFGQPQVQRSVSGMGSISGRGDKR